MSTTGQKMNNENADLEQKDAAKEEPEAQVDGGEGNSSDKDADPVVDIKLSELNRLKKEATEYKDKFVRLFAEFENARKRNERERAEFIKYANGEMVVEILNIVDDFERSLEAARNKDNDPAVLLKGSEMVLRNMHDLLKRNNVKPMEVVGLPFDPNHHEALMQAPSEHHEDGVVIEEFQKGYYMGDRVVRTAKVKVARNN